MQHGAEVNIRSPLIGRFTACAANIFSPRSGWSICGAISQCVYHASILSLPAWASLTTPLPQPPVTRAHLTPPPPSLLNVDVIVATERALQTRRNRSRSRSQTVPRRWRRLSSRRHIHGDFRRGASSRFSSGVVETGPLRVECTASSSSERKKQEIRAHMGVNCARLLSDEWRRF